MNKYLIPICDIDEGSTWIEVISAKSISDCQDKLMNNLIEKYRINDPYLDYYNFVEDLDDKFDVLIGDIQDIEAI